MTVRWEELRKKAVGFLEGEEATYHMVINPSTVVTMLDMLRMSKNALNETLEGKQHLPNCKVLETHQCTCHLPLLMEFLKDV